MNQLNTIQAQPAGLMSQQQLSREQVELIKTTICKGATDDELKLFVQVCNKTGLDPFTKQIHSVKRWNPETSKEEMAIQVGIDGLRLQAQRSKKYRGQTAPLWCGRDGVWKEVWLEDVPPAAAKVGVYHADFDQPVWGIARFDSYCQRKRDGSPTRMWKTMGDNQLAKCAEALALRKAFPNETSGLFIGEEMEQADNEEPKRLKSVPPPVAPPAPGSGTTWTEEEVTEAKGLLQQIRACFQAIGQGDRFQTYETKKLEAMETGSPEAILAVLRRDLAAGQERAKAMEPPPPSPPPQEPDGPVDVPFELTPGSESVDEAQQIPAAELNGAMVENWNRIALAMTSQGMKQIAINREKTNLMTGWTKGVDPSDSEAFERAIVRGQIAWLRENP